MPDSDTPRVRRRASSAVVTATGYRTIAYYLPAELQERLKAAWWGTRDLDDGAPSLNALVELVLTQETERLEQAHNEGRPFPPAPEGARGRSRLAAERQGEWLSAEWARRREAAQRQTSKPDDNAS